MLHSCGDDQDDGTKIVIYEMCNCVVQECILNVFIQLIEENCGSLLRYIVIFKVIGYSVDGTEIIISMEY